MVGNVMSEQNAVVTKVLECIQQQLQLPKSERIGQVFVYTPCIDQVEKIMRELADGVVKLVKGLDWGPMGIREAILWFEAFADTYGIDVDVARLNPEVHAKLRAQAPEGSHTKFFFDEGPTGIETTPM